MVVRVCMMSALAPLTRTLIVLLGPVVVLNNKNNKREKKKNGNKGRTFIRCYIFRTCEI